MRPRPVTTLVFGLLAGIALSSTQSRPDAAVKRELQAMAGTWKEISRVRDGQNLPAAQLGTMTQDENGKAEQRVGDRFGLVYSVKIDPTKTPKTIDYIVSMGTVRGDRPASITGATGETRQGIYDLNGDTLRICLARPSMDRPTEFVSPPGKDLVLSVYQRQK